MPRNIRICDIGTKILEFFLVTSTTLVISAVWFGPITHKWDFLANPAAWIAGGIAIFLIEFVLFWLPRFRPLQLLGQDSRGTGEKRRDDLLRRTQQRGCGK